MELLVAATREETGGGERRAVCQCVLQPAALNRPPHPPGQVSTFNQIHSTEYSLRSLTLSKDYTFDQAIWRPGFLLYDSATHSLVVLAASEHSRDLTLQPTTIPFSLGQTRPPQGPLQLQSYLTSEEYFPHLLALKSNSLLQIQPGDRTNLPHNRSLASRYALQPLQSTLCHKKPKRNV